MSIQANEQAAMVGKVDKALDIIRPYLKIDGGDVEVVEVSSDMIVKIRLLGNCKDCQISEMTLKAGIEQCVINALPDIKSVEEVA